MKDRPRKKRTGSSYFLTEKERKGGRRHCFPIFKKKITGRKLNFFSRRKRGEFYPNFPRGEKEINSTEEGGEKGGRRFLAEEEKKMSSS